MQPALPTNTMMGAPVDGGLQQQAPRRAGADAAGKAAFGQAQALLALGAEFLQQQEEVVRVLHVGPACQQASGVDVGVGLDGLGRRLGAEGGDEAGVGKALHDGLEGGAVMASRQNTLCAGQAMRVVELQAQRCGRAGVGGGFADANAGVPVGKDAQVDGLAQRQPTGPVAESFSYTPVFSCTVLSLRVSRILFSRRFGCKFDVEL